MYESFTMEELLKKKRELNTKRDALKAEIMNIVAAIETKESEKKIKDMSPQQIKSFRKLLGVTAIETQEKVGVPGIPRPAETPKKRSIWPWKR